jgi:hypothetical protein
MMMPVPQRSDTSRVARLYWCLRDVNTKSKSLKMWRWLLELNGLGYHRCETKFLPPLASGKVRMDFRLEKNKRKANKQFEYNLWIAGLGGMRMHERLAWMAWKDDPIKFAALLQC